MKKKGFNLVEILAIMVIAGILLAISAGTYQGWRAKSSFFKTNDILFELITTARVNALSEKKCRSGEKAEKWIIQINNNITEKNFRLFCNDTLLVNLEEPLKTSNKDYDLQENIFTTNLYVGISPISISQIEIEFFPGESQSRINNNFGNTIFRIDTIFISNSVEKKTICFDKVRGYAFFSTTPGECVE